MTKPAQGKEGAKHKKTSRNTWTNKILLALLRPAAGHSGGATGCKARLFCKWLAHSEFTTDLVPNLMYKLMCGMTTKATPDLLYLLY